jgi:hypothetical protein
MNCTNALQAGFQDEADHEPKNNILRKLLLSGSMRPFRFKEVHDLVVFGASPANLMTCCLINNWEDI